jgi:pilus assembly protein Flp/PilA
LELFLAAKDGATSLEYAFIASLIAVVIIGGATAVGTNVTAVFNAVASGFAL